MPAKSIVRNLMVVCALLAPPAAAQMVFRHAGEDGGEADVMILQELGVVVGLPEGEETIRVMVLLPDRESDVDLQRDDLLLMLNGERVRDMATLRAAYETAAAGDEIKMGFRRGDRRFLASFEKQDAPPGERRVVMMGGPGSDLGDLQPLHEFGVLLGEKEGSVVVTMQLPVDEPALAEQDVVRSVNGRAVSSLQEFREVYDGLAVGDDVEVVAVHDGDEVRVSRVKADVEGRIQVRRAP
jgi:hypothetical protein